MGSEPADDRVFCRDCGERINPRAEICPACGVRQRPPPAGATDGVPQKHPGLAAVASFLVPGLGQIYNGQIGKGLVLLVVVVGLAITIVGLVVAIPLWIWQIYDAYRTADEGGPTAIEREPPDPADVIAVVDHVLKWRVVDEGDSEERLRIGTLRRTVRDDGLTSLPADDVAYIRDVIDRYDREDGTIDTVHVRQRLDGLLEG